MGIMKSIVIETKQIFLILFLMAAVITPRQILAGTGPQPVDLGLAAHFAILAGTAISSTGGGIINGDIGLSPLAGAFITGLTTAQVNGTIYAVDTTGPAGSSADPMLLSLAKNDLSNAYNDAKSRSVDQIALTDGENIGGQTLVPGLYRSATSLAITGDLILDAGGASNAVWIFQMGSTLTTADGGAGNPLSQVVLTNGALARNIIWQVGSSATLGTYSVFKGTILAQVTISMGTGSIMEGRALASTGAVTFNSQNGSLPMPEAPRFTSITTSNDTVTVVVNTTPYYLLTLEACPDLLITNWTTVASAIPTTSLWTNTEHIVMAVATQCFFRAYLTP